MRRRQPAAGPPAVPPELIRFTPDDWSTEREPRRWSDGGNEYPWPLYAARRQWLAARRAWVAEQADPITARQVLRLTRPTPTVTGRTGA